MKHDGPSYVYSHERHVLFGYPKGLDPRLTRKAVQAVRQGERCVVAVIAVRKGEDRLANVAFELAEATARVGQPEEDAVGINVLLLDLGSAGGGRLRPVREGALFYGGLTGYLKNLREVLAAPGANRGDPDPEDLPRVADYVARWGGTYGGADLLAAPAGEPTRRMPGCVTADEMDYLYASANAHYDAVVVAVNLERLHHDRAAIAACRPWLEEADALYLAGTGMVAAYDAGPGLPPAVLAHDDAVPLVLGLRLDRGWKAPRRTWPRTCGPGFSTAGSGTETGQRAGRAARPSATAPLATGPPAPTTRTPARPTSGRRTKRGAALEGTSTIPLDPPSALSPPAHKKRKETA